MTLQPKPNNFMDFFANNHSSKQILKLMVSLIDAACKSNSQSSSDACQSMTSIWVFKLITKKKNNTKGH